MKELVYPGEVEVRMYAGKPGRSRFKGKSIPLPNRIRHIIKG